MTSRRCTTACARPQLVSLCTLPVIWQPFEPGISCSWQSSDTESGGAGAGQFGVELYSSVGVVLRNSLSHFYNPETGEGLVIPPLGDDAQELNPNPEVLLRARWEISMLQGPHPSAVGKTVAPSSRPSPFSHNPRCGCRRRGGVGVR